MHRSRRDNLRLIAQEVGSEELERRRISAEYLQLRLTQITDVNQLRKVATGEVIAHIWGSKHNLFHIYMTSVETEEEVRAHREELFSRYAKDENLSQELFEYQGTLSPEEAAHEADMIERLVQAELELNPHYQESKFK